LNNVACVVQAKKEAKRAEKREQERSAAGSQRPPRAFNASAAPSAAPVAAPDGGDTSGSESVSGGDDEPDVDVPAEMVAAVAEQVIVEARLREEAAAKEAGMGSATPRPAPVTTEAGISLAPLSVTPHGDKKLTFSNVKSPLAKQTPQRSPVGLKQGRRQYAEGGHVADAPYSPTVTQGAAQPSSSSAAKARSRVSHTATAPSDSENDADAEVARVRSHRRAPRAGATGSDRKVTAGAVAQSVGGDHRKRGASSNSGTQSRTENLASSSGSVPTPVAAETQLTLDELEAKNAAALMSLRSMKLKKVTHTFGRWCFLLLCVNQTFALL
jgi:hypothetical protein